MPEESRPYIPMDQKQHQVEIRVNHRKLVHPHQRPSPDTILIDSVYLKGGKDFAEALEIKMKERNEG